MSGRRLHGWRGFSRLELTLAAALLAVFVFVLASRVLAYRAEAERVAAEQLVGTLRTAMQVRAAKALIEPGDKGLKALLEENPLDWLAEKPSNYLGEYYAPDLELLEPGNWFFDRADRSLVYVLDDTKSFSLRTSNFLKFKVKLSNSPNTEGSDGSGQANIRPVFDQVSDVGAVNN